MLGFGLVHNFLPITRRLVGASGLASAMGARADQAGSVAFRTSRLRTGRVSGMAKASSARPAAPKAPRQTKAAGSPNRSATHPASDVLNIAPRALARPSEPMAKFR